MSGLVKRLCNGRVFALLAAMTLSLGGAFLFAQDLPDDALVGSKISKTYHKASCETAKKITEKNKVELLSADEARILQLKPCPVCKPAGSPPAKSPAKKPAPADPKTDDDDGEMKAEKTVPVAKTKKAAAKKATPPAADGADGEMKAEKTAPVAKTKKAAAKKAMPSEAATATDGADGEMKNDGAMMPKAKGKRAVIAKGAMKKADAAALAKTAAKDAPKADATVAAVDDKSLKFSEEIAPILAGNCIRCHNAQQKRGGFDLANFQKLMSGSAKRKVIVAGKPDESELILRIRGESEGPKMPPGQANLAPESIAKIEEWIKAGAILNAGIEPTAALETIAPSPEARRRKELAKLSPEERDKKLVEVATERWKKASSKTTPTLSSGKNFLLFSNLPKDRTDRVLKALDTQKLLLANILGPASNNALNGNEKISIYVFNDLSSYVEFVRSVENREIEQGVEAHGKLDVEQPYLAAADPLNGGQEAAPAATSPTTKKPSKTKKAAVEETHDGPDRSLSGLLSEQLGVSATTASGKSPRWLSYGIGAYVASKVDSPGSGYYRKLRETAFEKSLQGWESKANEALGGEGDPETIRAIGFSLCEWQVTALPRFFPMFVRGMLQGGEKLDDVVRGCFGEQTTRQIFLEQWGGFVASRYSRRR